MNERNHGLDGLRGIGAIAVVLFHLRSFDINVVNSGYLAVDFFFVLSGFVLTRSYEQSLQQGLSAARFIQARLIRLYPMYLIGAILGLVQTLILLPPWIPHFLSADQLAASSGLAILMLPALPSGRDLFPLNAPSWSLLFEIGASLVFCLVLCRSRDKILFIVALASALFVVAGTEIADTLNLGAAWHFGYFGAFRTLYAFVIGQLIARSCSSPRSPRSLLAVVGWPVLIFFFWQDPDKWRAPRDLIFALTISPMILWLGASYAVPRSMDKICSFLGRMSYPVYCVHYPVMIAVVMLTRALGYGDAASTSCTIVAVAAMAYLLLRYIDEPVRAALAMWMKPKDMLRVTNTSQSTEAITVSG
jgi:peptidoglycan/LPS O-acetylase OafA/YrhL